MVYCHTFTRRLIKYSNNYTLHHSTTDTNQSTPHILFKVKPVNNYAANDNNNYNERQGEFHNFWENQTR